MLELIELEARARAIRSQLALEPVTKIELDDSDDEVPEESPVTGPVKQNAAPQSSKRKSSESTKKRTELNKKAPEPAKKTSTSKSTGENSKKTTSENNKESSSKTSESTKTSNDTHKKSTEQPKKLSDVAKKSTDPPKLDTTKKSNDKLKSIIERPRKSISPPAQITKRRVVINRSDHGELTITAPAPRPSAPPVKLKRNFSKTSVESNISSKSNTNLTTSKTQKDIDITVKEEMITESRSSSPDVITMEQNISTYFISDSEDEEPPTKRKTPEKSPQKEMRTSEKPKSPEKVQENLKVDECLINKLNDQKTNEASMEVTENSEIVKEVVSEVLNENKNSTGEPKNSSDIAPVNKNSGEEQKSPDNIKSSHDEAHDKESESLKEIPEEDQNELGEIVDDEPEKAPLIDEDDDNVVNLMSDTEIDLNPSDKEDDDVDTRKKPSTSKFDKAQVETPKEVSHSNDSDDDIVEILNSDDDTDLDNESKSAENPEEAVTWNQRYLRSSTVKTVLKTTKLASKVREKLAATKKSQKETIQKKKNDEKEKQKEITEKISKLEEGSLEQFQLLKESSDSSI